MKFTVISGLLCFFGLAFTAPVAAQADGANGPSFNCEMATGTVEQMICHSPKLSAADRDLADVYSNTANQGGIDAKALRRAEDAWLVTRNLCSTDDCIAAAYATRKAQILDESLQAASPAAYAETRPYPAPPAILAVARNKIGQVCGAVGFGGSPPPPFTTIQGFLPVITGQGTILPLAGGGARFAFLVNTANGACTVTDVVTLPPAGVADVFLECFPVDSDSMGLPGMGAGMRKSGIAGNVAYWDINPQTETFTREPLSVLGLDKDGLRCQQPETGD